MQVSVIGGSGFIGTRLVRRLTRHNNYQIKIFDKNPSKVYSKICTLGDVRSDDHLRKFISEESVVINLAAEHQDNVRPLNLYYDVNVGGARNICMVAREKRVKKIIFTSSVAVYGFAPVGTDEHGCIAPFNDYGRSKYDAEQIFKVWQAEAPDERTLVIIRPTVVFGEQNRGNVYNLLRQISSGKFVMVGHGNNRKSIAYVENVAAFIEYCIGLNPSAYIFNYIDKPDFTMNNLVGNVNNILGQKERISFRLPFFIAHLIGKIFDLAAALTGRRFAISSIRVKKFCANSVYDTNSDMMGFVPPISLQKALEKTVLHEFVEQHGDEPLYFSE